MRQSHHPSTSDETAIIAETVIISMGWAKRPGWGGGGGDPGSGVDNRPFPSLSRPVLKNLLHISHIA